MTHHFIHTSLTDGIATLVLNRVDKCNALHGVMITELLSALQFFANNNKVRVLLLYGNGEHFCAGADLEWMQQLSAGSYNANYDDAQLLADLMYQLYSFPMPTIALAQGATRGGGMGLLAACDIAIAANNAHFAFSEVKVGITPATISPYVVAAIGERAAHYYFLTGEKFTAEEAYRLQLIQRMVEKEALISTGLMLAQSLQVNSPQALLATKKLLRHIAKEKISEALAQKTAEHLANVRASDDAREGLQAFLQKRAPQWK